MDPLRVVVLVPEDRQDDHRLAEVDALGGRVVAAVGDHEIHLGQHRNLRDELGPGHVGGQLVCLVLRSLRDDVAVRRLGQRLHEPLHERHVGRSERSKAEVDQRALALERGGHRPRRIARAHARLEVVPGRAKRLRARVIELPGIEVQVQPR